MAFINNCLQTNDAALKNNILHEKAYPGLKKDLSLYISNLLSGKRVGE